LTLMSNLDSQRLLLCNTWFLVRIQQKNKESK